MVTLSVDALPVASDGSTLLPTVPRRKRLKSALGLGKSSLRVLELPTIEPRRKRLGSAFGLGESSMRVLDLPDRSSGGASPATGAELTVPEAVAFALRQQPHKLLAALAPSLAGALVGAPFFAVAAGWFASPGSPPPHPVWTGIWASVVMSCSWVAAFSFTESQSRWIKLRSDAAASGLAIALFWGISAAFVPPLWASPMPHTAWAYTPTILLRLCVPPVLNLRSRAIKLARTIKGHSICSKLRVYLLIALALNTILYVVVGAVFAMRFCAENNDPALEALLICVVYPMLRFALKSVIFTLTSKVGLNHDDSAKEIAQIVRITMTIEIVFGLPGMCATALMSWQVL